ncbi:hypothetical protein B0H14DRAFT_2603803 [Mycena olivaceomarginata]|nr:hypothetical protein B0H14DRAFT_2603803 [Mycena olivaceomarginata]
MTQEFMTRMFEWSDNICPPSNYDKTSTTREEENLKTKHLAFKCFSSTSWTIWSRCFELRKLQRKHLTFGLEDSKAFNTPYFELKLTNRKGWQKRINKTQKEADLRSGKFKICAQSDVPACDAFTWMIRWVKYLEEDVYGHPLQPDDYIFPATGANGIVQTGEHISHEDVQKWITEFATGADLPCANGTFSTHCFRRGGAQYRFMFAAVGRRWTLRQRDTLIKYLLDELNTYEDDYSGMLLTSSQPDTDRTFLGEGAFDRLLSIVASTITGSASQPSPSIGSDRANIPGPQSSLTIQCPRGLPAFHLTRPLIPISLSTPAIIAASNSVSVSTRRLPDKGLIVPDVPVTLPSGMRSHKRDSWHIILEHREKGDPTHGLTTPLRDWPKEWLTGMNKPLVMKHTQRKIIATEFIVQYNRNEEDFLKAYPEAEDGSSRLLAAINEARKKRGDLIPLTSCVNIVRNACGAVGATRRDDARDDQPRLTRAVREPPTRYGCDPRSDHVMTGISAPAQRRYAKRKFFGITRRIKLVSATKVHGGWLGGGVYHNAMWLWLTL